MESYKIENLTFTYPGAGTPALSDVSLEIGQGEFVTLCGKSGCGKTTLLRLLKSSLSPHGILDGRILFEGKELCEHDGRAQTERMGFVMQDPDSQIVTDKVWHELAFGLESLGFDNSEIRARVSEMASFFGIEAWFHKKTTELSGGQKQMLTLASVMVMQPSVLILDEPTSRLDPIASSDFLKTLHKINRELGVTVILSEHRLEEALPISDRVIVLDGGSVIADTTPEKIGRILKDKNHDMLLALPVPMRIYSAADGGDSYPITVREGRVWLEKYSVQHTLDTSAIPVPCESAERDDSVVEIKDAFFRYEKSLPDVINGLNLKINKGELFAILGGNGTGKTTALSLISRLNKPYRGEVRIKGKNISEIKNLYNGILGVMPQNPQSLFVKSSLFSDLFEVLDDTDLPQATKEDRVKSIARLCKVDLLLDRHPYDLSGGEQQRAALAKVLLREPEILLLDEPTKGMDAHFKEIFAGILGVLKARKVTVIMVTHDIEFCAEYADRCALFFDGSVTSVGVPRKFFAGKSFYTTSANRMARSLLPGAIIAEDVILACGGDVPPKNTCEPFDFSTPQSGSGNTFSKSASPNRIIIPKESSKLSLRAVISALCLLLAIPLTVCLGTTLLEGRKYYFISLLVILETMIPFFMIFERRKPRARELIIISTLCAIAVAGRTAFFMFPQFKPVVALIIISGVCFGGETGFLVGAVTGFVSNFFFGQGPWTPWQMFAFGIIGFVSGILFRRRFLPPTRLSLCIYGALATFVMYGGILNPANVIMSQSKPTLEMLVASYAAGAPYDLIHAFSTAFFLWFLSVPMIEKLERIKVKYGLVKNEK